MISLSAMEKIMKKAGAHRVSEDAKAELCRVLEAEGLEIATKALKISKHAGRKTIKKSDIELARS